MDDEHITKIALSVSLLGCVFLFFLLENQNSEMDMLDYKDGKQDDKIVISGEVISSRQTKNITIIKLQPKDHIDIVTFSKINVSGNIRIEGKIDIDNEYGRQIMAEEITLLSS